MDAQVYRLAKIHKRLCVVKDTGETVYTPPDFIKVHSRSAFDTMLEDLNLGRQLINAVMAFEAANHPTKALRLSEGNGG